MRIMIIYQKKSKYARSEIKLIESHIGATQTLK